MNERENTARAAYILSQRQGLAMIATLLGLDESEVEELIAEGERLLGRDRGK